MIVLRLCNVSEKDLKPARLTYALNELGQWHIVNLQGQAHYTADERNNFFNDSDPMVYMLIDIHTKNRRLARPTSQKSGELEEEKEYKASKRKQKSKKAI